MQIRCRRAWGPAKTSSPGDDLGAGDAQRGDDRAGAEALDAPLSERGHEARGDRGIAQLAEAVGRALAAPPELRASTARPTTASAAAPSGS